MKRLLLDALLHWKNRTERKPLLIDGARQTGKTYLLNKLLGATFTNVIRIDFLEQPEFSKAFQESLSPLDIISNIELILNQAFNPTTDLLILDEIGECQRAVTSLKYFAEQTPTFFIAASGSNIGLLNSFPVGKVEQYNVRPLSFQEFIWASKEQALINAFENNADSEAAHSKLFEKLTDYYFTGGMPEAVMAWFADADADADADASILEKVANIQRIHKNLIEGYKRDFGKYSGKIDANRIESVFTNVPNQLASADDESVKKFKFKDIYQKKARYSDFESSITWLHRCRLVLKNYTLEGYPKSPLAAYKKPNKVKLFYFDVGLLNYALGSHFQEIKAQKYEYKGYIAENFIQQEFAVLGIEPSYSWHDARAEIEFVVSTNKGDIIPIEVKSGIRTRAKSLDSYIKKCCPNQTIKFTGTRGSSVLETTHLVRPLYYVGSTMNALLSAL